MPATQTRESRGCHGFQPQRTPEVNRREPGAFKVERRGSRGSRSRGSSRRPSYGPTSPEPMTADQEEQKDVWLAAWEQRLKLREATLEQQGCSFPKSRATPVLTLKCSCGQQLSDEAMEVYYKNAPDATAFCAKERPTGIKELHYDVDHGLCGCCIREIECTQCNTKAGFRIRERCVTCRTENGEDEGHTWFFEEHCVQAQPKFSPTTGEAMFWPGWEEAGESSSEVSPTDPNFFDENSMIRPDGDTSPGWNCSPLADRNGRPRASFGKAANAIQAAREAEIFDKEAAFKKWEEDLRNQDIEQVQKGLSQGVREKYLRDATAQQDINEKEYAARESELAARENALHHVKLHLDARELELRQQAQAQDQVAGSDEASRRAIDRADRAEQRAATYEAEAEALRGQATEQRSLTLAAEDMVSMKNQEIQQLQTALAEVRREVRKSVDGSGALVGRGRLPPTALPPTTDEDTLELVKHIKAPAELVKRIHDLEQELTAERVELTSVRMEAQQAKLLLETKEAELEKLLPELVASRTQGSQRLHSRDAELDRLRSELTQLRPEVERLRTEATLRSSSTRAPAVAEPDDYVQARLACAQKLSEKRQELDLREQALASREAALPQGFGELGAMHGHRFAPLHGGGMQPAHPPQYYYGGSGCPPVPGGGVFERLLSGCPRRQPNVYTGRMR